MSLEAPRGGAGIEMANDLVHEYAKAEAPRGGAGIEIHQSPGRSPP